MRGADILVEMLIKQGVEVVFGVPGDTSMAFHDALRLRQKEIRHILCRDERHAAYAADAYARVTGKVGVVEVPSGGGALYVVPGLSEADCSNIPLVCLASEITMSSIETNALTDCNQERLFSAVTKWNTTVTSPALLPRLVRKAFRQAAGGAQGAAALTLPENVLRGEYTGSEADLAITPRTEFCSAFRNEPAAADVAEMVTMLKAASRPAPMTRPWPLSSAISCRSSPPWTAREASRNTILWSWARWAPMAAPRRPTRSVRPRISFLSWAARWTTSPLSAGSWFPRKRR